MDRNDVEAISDYAQIRYLDEIDKEIAKCYLCGEALETEETFDHIIPNELFSKSDPHRPKLLVHHNCNNLKSKDDEWFVKQLQLRSSFDPLAEKQISTLLQKAIDERPDAYIVGKKLHNYKLAKGMFDNVTWGLELKHGDRDLMQMKFSVEDSTRFRRYLENMCRGLFIRNVPLTEPPIPELIPVQNADLELRGKNIGFVESIKNFVNSSTGSNFMQQWGNRMTYIGSRVAETPNKGYLFIQFYSQFSILAVFK